MSKYNHEFSMLQQQYLSIIRNFSFNTSDDDYYYRAVLLIEKCESFWFEHRQEVLEILDDLSSSEQCFLLSGAIYLDVLGNGHFAFGALGERHFINDPIIKMKEFFSCSNGIVSGRLKEYFASVVSDTITVLTRLPNYFSVIPVESLLYSNTEEYCMLAEGIYWDIISSALNRDIRSLEALDGEFRTIEELENALEDKLPYFVFNNLLDAKLSLKERVQKWISSNNAMIDFGFSSDIGLFFIASMSQIQQAVEILARCLALDLYPFIRYEVSLQYFILIADGFSKDERSRSRFEYALVSYLFSNFIIQADIENVGFQKFFQLCKEKKLAVVLHDSVFTSIQSLSSIDVIRAKNTMLELYAREIQDAL